MKGLGQPLDLQGDEDERRVIAFALLFLLSNQDTVDANWPTAAPRIGRLAIDLLARIGYEATEQSRANPGWAL